jgi:formylglycine-generating enzyme required for sulfatase activity
LELEKIIPFEATGKESRKIEDPSQKKKLKIQALLLIVVVCLVGLIIIFFSKYFENKEIGSHNMGNENTGVGKEGPKIFTSPYLEAQFVLIPKGEFIMGANEGVYYERKEHNVILSRPFYIQTTEITQGQWKKVMGKNPSLFSNCGDDCPVENVSWNDIQSFIGRVNSNEGTNKYRLPTEAEWEYAARAGTKTRFYTGRCISASQANFSFYDIGGECPKGGALGKPTKVASYPPNPWGLYDMSGNIAEWVQDWYGIYSEGKVMDPEGDAIQKDKVIRGGNWHTTAYSSAVRNYAPPDHRDQYTGFRLARTY